MSINDTESIKIVVALRMARAALGISQLELAELLGVSKITLARVETLEAPLKADVYMKAIKVFRERGGGGCSGSIKPDTNMGGNLTPLNEVFNGKTTTYIFNGLQK